MPSPGTASLASDKLRGFLARLDERLTALEAFETDPTDPAPAPTTDQRQQPQLAATGSYVWNTVTSAVHRTLVPAEAASPERCLRTSSALPSAEHEALQK